MLTLKKLFFLKKGRKGERKEEETIKTNIWYNQVEKENFDFDFDFLNSVNRGEMQLTSEFRMWEQFPSTFELVVPNLCPILPESHEN